GLVEVSLLQVAAGRAKHADFQISSTSKVQHPPHSGERQTVSYSGGDVEHLAAEALVYPDIAQHVLAAQRVQRPGEIEGGRYGADYLADLVPVVDYVLWVKIGEHVVLVLL